MSYVFMIIGWALAGWCGTGIARPPRPPGPDPPGPRPWRPVWGVIGGIAVGLAFHFMFPAEGAITRLDYAVTCIGAFIGGVILYDLIELGRKENRA